MLQRQKAALFLNFRRDLYDVFQPAGAQKQSLRSSSLNPEPEIELLPQASLI